MTVFVYMPLTILVLMAVAGFGRDGILVIGFIGLIDWGVKGIEFLTGPKKPFVCEICEFNWELSDAQ